MRKIYFALLMSCVFTVGCASTPREKVIQNMLIAGASGFVVGALTQENNRPLYGVLYGGIAATGTGLVSLWYSPMDEQYQSLWQEHQTLKAQIQNDQPELLLESPGTLAGQIPEEYRDLVAPGVWRVYQIDRWVQESENRLVHQDKVMELVPPSLVPKKRD